MLRANKGFDYSGYLDASDVHHLNSRIDEHGWYPMESFERLGLAILGEIIRGDLEMTKVWGHTTVELLSARYPELVEHSDPTETIRRFKVLQNSFFNFYPLQIREQLETEVRVQIAFGHGDRRPRRTISVYLPFVGGGDGDAAACPMARSGRNTKVSPDAHRHRGSTSVEPPRGSAIFRATRPCRLVAIQLDG